MLGHKVEYLLKQLLKMKKETKKQLDQLAKWNMLLQENNEILKKKLCDLERTIYPDKAQEADNARLLEKLFSEAYFSEMITDE